MGLRAPAGQQEMSRGSGSADSGGSEREWVGVEGKVSKTKYGRLSI